MHFFVTKTIYELFLLRKQLTHTFFVAKMICALRPESFCALKVAIRKVQTFWASGLKPIRQSSDLKDFVQSSRSVFDGSESCKHKQCCVCKRLSHYQTGEKAERPSSRPPFTAAFFVFVVKMQFEPSG